MICHTCSNDNISRHLARRPRPTCHSPNLAWAATNFSAPPLPVFKQAGCARKEITPWSDTLTPTVNSLTTPEAIQADVLREGEAESRAKTTRVCTKPFEQRGGQCHGGGDIRRNARVHLPTVASSHRSLRLSPRPPPVEGAHKLARRSTYVPFIRS